jgi:ABC-type nitrate/sulfonate/bicarbonate transport system substrate-binding protein
MSSRGFGIGRPGWLLLGAVLALGLLMPEAASAQAQKVAPIRVSYQPATYWSLPFLVATEQGFWGQEGLKPELLPFPSGAPQVDAGAQEAWDVGGMGSVPAVLGASRYGLLTIGITNDESMANAVMVRGDAAATWLKRPARDLRRKTVMVTRSSTGEYVLLAYLKSLKLTEKDVKVLYMDQTAIVKAFAGKGGDVFVLWAPYLYDALARGGKVLANGGTAGVTVPGALVAVPRFAREHPDAVARFLRVYLKALEWQRANPAAALDILAKDNEQAGIKLDKRWFAESFKTRQVWGIAGQLGLLARPQGQPSIADGWFSEVGAYFTAAGALQANPDTKTYLTDEYMKLATGPDK